MRLALVMAAAIGCDGKESDGGGGKAWTETSYSPPILSERALANPFDPKSDPKARAAFQIGEMFNGNGARRVGDPDYVAVIYDGTDTLFLRMAKCDHETLARRLQVIDAKSLRSVGYKVLACADHPAAIEVR